MKRYSLTARVALLFALLSLCTLSFIGITLYHGIEKQLTLHDDAMFLTRVTQLRSFLHDPQNVEFSTARPMILERMLDGTESILKLRVVGEPTLLNINPGLLHVPDLYTVPDDASLSPEDLYRSKDATGTPFVAIRTFARIAGSQRLLEITVARAMNERTVLLKNCRDRILIQVLIAALLFAAAGYWLVRRGLQPLAKIAAQTERITVHNLTARIESGNAPKELLPVIDSFNAMLGRMHTGFAKLSQVSADMAHDLRTPINNLLGQTEVALSQARSAEHYEALLVSNWEELKRLSKMTDSMLFLARSENAETRIECKQLNVSTELTCIAEYFEVLAEEAELSVSTHGFGELYADPMLLRRALGNLMANAIQYADRHTTIILQSRSLVNGVELSVQNRGPTISEQHLHRVFDRFYRADASRRGSANASGLGLSIVRGIMALHGGDCKATSKNGLTCFTLFFPTATVLKNRSNPAPEFLLMEELA